MFRLLAVSAVLAMIFASTFLVIKSLGIFTLADIKAVLLWASEVNVFYLGTVVVALLFMDMFIAIPTLTIVTLSGYFMGPLWGAIFSIFGMWTAGVVGYLISRRWGDRLLLKIYREEEKLKQMRDIFNQYGVFVLLLCRAAPILPEVSCCLSGVNKMSFTRFFLFYSLGTVPYALLATFAGSQSSIDDPLPGVIGGVSMSIVLWLCWLVLIKYYARSKVRLAE